MKSFLILVLIAASAFSAQASLGDERGNGGGGITRGRVYMTFGSAGFYVKPESLKIIPGLLLARNTLNQLNIPNSTKHSLLESLLPMGERKYYNIEKDQLDPATHQKLIEEYAKLMNQPPSEIVIFAVTDQQKRVTFILPEFYQLKETEQAAILFHELYWLAKPKATYMEVIQSEIAFQRFVESAQRGVYDPGLGYALADMFNDQTYSLRLDWAADFKSVFAGKKGLSPNLFLSPSTIASCKIHLSNFSGDLKYDGYRFELRGPSLNILLYELSEKYNSLFLANLRDYLAIDTNGNYGSIILQVKTKNQNLNPYAACNFNVLKRLSLIESVSYAGSKTSVYSTDRYVVFEVEEL